MFDKHWMFTFRELKNWSSFSEATLKNWTNQRPLRIAPKMTAGGRFFWGAGQLYLLEVLRRLIEFGFMVSKLQPVVDQLDEDTLLQFGTAIHAIQLTRAGDNFGVEVLQSVPERFDVPKDGVFLLDVTDIPETIRRQIEETRPKLAKKKRAL